MVTLLSRQARAGSINILTTLRGALIALFWAAVLSTGCQRVQLQGIDYASVSYRL